MSDYDLSIHGNPDARAWARFFLSTATELGWKLPPEVDESMMFGWFANAMMAMHDHLARHPPSCVSRASSTCVYLRDGTKVAIRRDGKSASLVIEEQAMVRPAALAGEKP